jgi:hypothetical protein
MLSLKLDLFRDAQCVIDFDPKVSNRAFQLRVTQEELYSPQIACLYIWATLVRRMECVP